MRNFDWLILITEKEHDEKIKNCIADLQIKNLMWRKEEKGNLVFHIFDTKPTEIITRISMAITAMEHSTKEIVHIIQIDKEGMF